jgi:uncharacterized membrane protein
MSVVETERKTQIRAFDRNLRNLIALSPDDMVRQDLNRALSLYRKRYCLPFDKKKVEIFNLIKSGAATFMELRSESGFPKKIVHKILAALIEENLIRVEKIKPVGAFGGRPKFLYFAN